MAKSSPDDRNQSSIHMYTRRNVELQGDHFTLFPKARPPHWSKEPKRVTCRRRLLSLMQWGSPNSNVPSRFSVHPELFPWNLCCCLDVHGRVLLRKSRSLLLWRTQVSPRFFLCEFFFSRVVRRANKTSDTLSASHGNPTLSPCRRERPCDGGCGWGNSTTSYRVMWFCGRKVKLWYAAVAYWDLGKTKGKATAKKRRVGIYSTSHISSFCSRSGRP